jgi:hypothetical protein
MPQEERMLEMVAKVLRDFTRRIPELRGLNYHVLAPPGIQEEIQCYNNCSQTNS